MLGSYVSIDPAEKLSLVYMHNLFQTGEAYIHPRNQKYSIWSLVEIWNKKGAGA